MLAVLIRLRLRLWFRNLNGYVHVSIYSLNVIWIEKVHHLV